MKLFMLALGFIFISIVQPVYAQDSTAQPLSVKGAFAYATTSVQKNGAAFFIVTNNTDKDQSIVGAESPIAERTELHTHMMDGDMMMMREVGSYDIAPGESITLEPMGHHIMFMGLKAPLKAGESFPLTLRNAGGKAFTITVEIQSPGGFEDHKDHSGHGP